MPSRLIKIYKVVENDRLKMWQIDTSNSYFGCCIFKWFVKEQRLELYFRHRCLFFRWKRLERKGKDSWHGEQCKALLTITFIRSIYIYCQMNNNNMNMSYVRLFCSSVTLQYLIQDHLVFYADLVYKLRRVKCISDCVSSDSKIVKRLRKYDSVIIERTISLMLGPSAALYQSFLEICTTANKALILFPIDC